MPARFKPLRDENLRVEVAKAIRDAIFDGSLGPGEQVQESAIARQMGISRGPIREALLMLEREGLIRIRPNRGAFVRSLTLDEVAEIFSLRLPLEAMALNLARPKTTAEIFNQLALRVEGIHNLFREGQINRMVQEIFVFHGIIWETSGHDLLKDTLVRICTPYFAFMWTLVTPAELGSAEKMEAEKLILDYLAGTSKLSAMDCMRRYLDMVHPASVESSDLLSGLFIQPG